MDKRASLITVITTPLGFFSLALLIVEGFLGIVVIGSGESLDSSIKLWGMVMAISSFALVIIIVALFMWLNIDALMINGETWSGIKASKVRKELSGSGEEVKETSSTLESSSNVLNEVANKDKIISAEKK